MIKKLLDKSLCKRRQVAAVVMDYCGNVLAAGHNGKYECFGCVRDYWGLERNQDAWICKNHHAEEMAIKSIKEWDSKEKIIFVTAEPCEECMKLILYFTDIVLLWYYNNNELIEIDLREKRDK